MYAIVDVETTGGKFNEEGITEIAIYRFDGNTIVDQFSSLINPLREIQPFVQRLTGINSKMLVNAPKFFEVAKRIVEITEGAVLVAHNAEFDYRVIRTEFKRLGFDFERPSLCTVDLSQKLLPDVPSYKLGKLVRSLGIPISDVHRAHGDAKATVELFKVLLDKDCEKDIITAHVKTLNRLQVPNKYLSIIEDLPTETGVYYLHDKNGKIIYIGKSKNIKKRVLTHLTSSARKSQKIQKALHSVSFELSGNECLALTPYHQLIIEQVRHDVSYIAVFKNKKEAEGRLRFWIEEYNLCTQHTSFASHQKSCFRYGIDKCKGACIGEEKCEVYNQRTLAIIESLKYPYPNMLVIDQGKKVGEKSFIYIKDGVFQGYGYFQLNHQIKTLDKIQNRLISIEDNRDTQAVIHSFLRKERYQKLINLADNEK